MLKKIHQVGLGLMVSNLSPLTVLPSSTSCVWRGGGRVGAETGFLNSYCWCLLPFLLVIMDNYLSGPVRQKKEFHLHEILGHGVLL